MTMTDKKVLTSAGMALLMVAAFTSVGPAVAATDSSNTSIAVDAITALQAHTTADCVPGEYRCHFTAGANLMTPEGPTGFPDGLWARQTVTLRSSSRDVGQEAGFSAPAGAPRETKGGNHDGVLSKMFKGLNVVEITAVYNGAGPIERFQIAGDSAPTDWTTGRPATGADFIVCTSIQVVYGGHNVTSPSTCSQTRF